MKVQVLLLLGLTQVGLLPPRALQAQQWPVGLVSGLSKGVTVDRFIYEGNGITAFSFRLSDLSPGSLGSEIGVSLFPEAIPAGALILAPDFGASYGVSVPGTTLLLKGGGSALTGIGGGFAFVPGYHFGAALVVQIDDRTGLRIDAIRHSYIAEGEPTPIWSIGAGFTAIPRRRP